VGSGKIDSYKIETATVKYVELTNWTYAGRIGG
jgi:hypothetical protein